MRRAIVLLSWLPLLWIGWNTAYRFAPTLAPTPASLSEDLNDSNEVERNNVVDLLQTPHTSRAMQSEFVRAPLSARPFAARLAGTIRNELCRCPSLQRSLAEHIIHIAPRNIVARLKLVELDYLAGNYSEAAAGISLLVELDRPSTNTFLDVLSAMAVQSKSQAAIAHLLKERPTWGANLVWRLSREMTDTDFLLAIASDYPSTHNAVVQSLVAKGDMDRAYAAFLQFLGKDVDAIESAPFNSRFERISGAEPFNWQTNQFFANIEPRGGLAVTFFGQGEPWIAEQTLKLSPGSYAANVIMEGSIYSDGNSFEWVLQCLNARQPLLRLPVEELTSVPKVLVGAFVVPTENCAYQRLRLSGVAGDFPRTARALVSEIIVRPAAETPTP